MDMPVLPTFARNLRYQLWREGTNREHWVAHLAGWLNCSERRALELLIGKTPNSEELQTLVQQTGIMEEQFHFNDLTKQITILAENLNYLVTAPKRGGKKELAHHLNIRPGTLSRWLAGKQRPNPKYQEMIKAYFGLPTAVDLETIPLFLELSPVGSYEQRAWLRQCVDELDDEALRVLFPALEKLLR